MSGSPSRVFRSYRFEPADPLGALLGRPCEVKVQEDFQDGSQTLLDRLADFVRDSERMIHLVGPACGAARDRARNFGEYSPQGR